MPRSCGEKESRFSVGRTRPRDDDDGLEEARPRRPTRDDDEYEDDPNEEDDRERGSRVIWKKAVALALVLPTAIAFVVMFRVDDILKKVVAGALSGALFCLTTLLWNGEPAGNKIKRASIPVILVLIAVLAGILVALHAPQFLESEHDKMVRMVTQTLKGQGIQVGVEPVVELTKIGDDVWTGTATYGTIIYDLRVSKDTNALSGWRMSRQQRVAQPEKRRP